MFCSNCGKELKKTFNFCPKCGTKVEREEKEEIIEEVEGEVVETVAEEEFEDEE